MLTLAQAKRIVTALVRLTFVAQGTEPSEKDGLSLSALRSLTLAELVEANRIVRLAPAPWVVQPDRSHRRTLPITCEDHHIAAIYLALRAVKKGPNWTPIIAVDGALVGVRLEAPAPSAAREPAES